MNEGNEYPKDSPTIQVRNALAINRAMVKLSKIRGESKPFTDKNDAANKLRDMFTKLHEDVFRDWQTRDDGRPGDYRDRKTRDDVLELVSDSLCTNGDIGKKGHKPDGLFDENGFVVRQDSQTLAKTLAKFYVKIRELQPFNFGNELAVDLFVVAIGKLPQFQAVFNQGIDYRRMDASDLRAIREGSNVTKLAKAFEHSLDPSRTPQLENQANGYGKWERHDVRLSGNRFLTHEQDGHTYLVTVNGGLVECTDTLQKQLHKHLADQKLLSDFPPIPDSQIVGYMPGTEKLRESNKTEIDGISVQQGSSPLFCLDQNILTGLGIAAQEELDRLMKKVTGKKSPIFDLANNSGLYEEMKRQAGGDERLQRIVDIAYDRVSRLTRKLDEEKNKIFQLDRQEHERTVKPVENPKLFMSMGGAGVGKTAVKNMARAQCGENFVEASLDDFRERSDLYTLLMAAKHHGDDYKTVEPFANSLRTFVADHAKAAHYNTFYDGTGIEYQPRYAQIVDDFKAERYNTNVVAIDTPLVTPPGRDAEFDVPAFGRVKERQAAIGRALPWTVVVAKHIDTAKSFIEAAEHKGLDKLSLYANDRGPGKHYLVAETFIMDGSKAAELTQAKKQGHLAQRLEQFSHGQDSALQLSGEPADQTRNRLSGANGTLDEQNVSFLVYPAAESGKKRVLAIYDNGRFVDMLEKGHMNKFSSGPEGLMHKSEDLTFHAGLTVNEEQPWMLRLRGAKDLGPPAKG